MNQKIFARKVTYFLIIIVMVIPITILGRPATRRTGQVSDPGGYLAQERARHEIVQASLGEIDPTSETIRLASFGMRGVGAYLLWLDATDHFKKKDWTSLSATLNQLTKLQPNFISVWSYQSWNLAYNVSAEWDLYKDKYSWIIRGLKFIEEGTNYNTNHPKLLQDWGRYTAQKIGIADEKLQLRELFRNDSDYHGTRPRDQWDNWLVGKEHHLEGIYAVTNLGKSLGKISPVLYYAQPALFQIKYATAMEDEGTFGERARISWQQAGREWKEYGLRQIPSVSFGIDVRLEDLEQVVNRKEALEKRLDELVPEARNRIRERMIAEKITAPERKALSKPAAERNAEEAYQAMQAEFKIVPTPTDIAKEAPEEVRDEATRLAEEATLAERQFSLIESDRSVVNYLYWAKTCQAEITDDALQGRESLYLATQAFQKDADIVKARELFEKGFQHWANVFNEFPEIGDDDLTAQEMQEHIVTYGRVLNQLDAPLPVNFPLQKILQKLNSTGQRMPGMVPSSLSPARPN